MILGAMTSPTSALDSDAMALAKTLLTRRKRPERMWPALGAAGLLAVSAIAFATAMILAPPLVSEHVASEKAAP